MLDEYAGRSRPRPSWEPESPVITARLGSTQAGLLPRLVIVYRFFTFLVYFLLYKLDAFCC